MTDDVTSLDKSPFAAARPANLPYNEQLRRFQKEAGVAQPRLELTILMPCLDEAETLATCIRKAMSFLARTGIAGEVLVADNGSVDGSQAIAVMEGARVVNVPQRGYGAALSGGIDAARGRYIIMGDADDSYDFSDSAKFVEKLKEGNDMVMGCRMPRGGGTIAPGAMPWKNRHIGNPFLSSLGRLFFRTPVQDFHCGLRAFTKGAYRTMQPQTTGMEFASEMIMKASILKLKVAEVPITLHKDGRSRPPHLRPWRDGWRHLRFMLIYSPRWLFLMPGMILGGLGALAALYFCFGWDFATRPTAGLNGLAIAAAGMITGLQLVAIAFFNKVFAQSEGLMPEDVRFTRMFRHFTLERGLILGALVLFAGIFVLIACAVSASGEHFPGYVEANRVREVLAGVTLLVLGVEGIFSSFFMSVLGLKTKTRRPPDPGDDE